MKTLIKTLALVATIVGFSSCCGSSPDPIPSNDPPVIMPPLK